METWTWKIFLLLSLQMVTVFTKKKHILDESGSDDGSIENILYYKDCKHKQKTTLAPVVPMMAREPPRPACPCPRMCCSMCCECEGPGPFIGRQMQPLQQMGGMHSIPQQPPMSMPPSFRAGMSGMPPGGMGGMGPGGIGPGGMGPGGMGPGGMGPGGMGPGGMGPKLANMPVQPQLQRRQRVKPNSMLPPESMLPPIGGRRNIHFTKDDIKSLISRDSDIKKILNNLVKVTMEKVDTKHSFRPTQAPKFSDEDYVE